MMTKTIPFENPGVPELVEQADFTWRVRLPDLYFKGVATSQWLSGPTLKNGEWVWLTQQDAYRAAYDWWQNKLSTMFTAKITKQVPAPKRHETWYEECGRKGWTLD